MIKKLSLLPALSSVRSSSELQPEDLIELSLSGVPLATYDPGGADEGQFSASGWASAKTRFDEFGDNIVSSTSGSIVESTSALMLESISAPMIECTSASFLEIISGNIFETDIVGTFHSSGKFVEITVDGMKKYIELFDHT